MSNGKYLTGLPINLVNDRTVRPNKQIKILATTSSATIVDTTIKSTNTGGFVVPFKIPISEQGKPINWIFTELDSGEIVNLSDITPSFDSTILLNIDQINQDLVAGNSSITGKVKVSQGYGVTLDLVNQNGVNFGSVSLNNTNGITNFSLPINDQANGDTYEIVATADLHTTVSKPINAQIKEAVTINQVNGLVFPGRTFVLTGSGPKNKNINLEVFGQTYLVPVGSNKIWSRELTAPIAQSNYVVTADFDGVIANSNIEVKSVSLSLDNCFVTPYKTNSGSPFAVFTGKLLPTKTLTANFIGLSTTQVEVTPDQDGNWELIINEPWREAGNFSATFSAPNEVSVICNGTHEPATRFTPESLSLKQGDSNNSIRFRARANTNYNFVVTGVLAKTGSVITNGLGFADILLDNVPLTVNTPSSGTITVADSSTQYNIEPRVPITINISNASLPDKKVLFTNNTYNVVGAIPENGVYNLSAIGEVNSFNLVAVANDSYIAELIVGNTPGIIDLEVATVNQPKERDSYIVSPPISFTLPDKLLSEQSYELTITSDPGELVQLVINGESGEIDFVVAEIPTGGTYTYNFDTTGLEQQKINFTVSNRYFSFDTQERQLVGLNRVDPGADLGLWSGGKTNTLEKQIASAGFALDNSAINEANKPYLSPQVLNWVQPTNADNLKEYSIEVYSENGWNFETTTTSNQYIPSFEAPRRVRPVYKNFTFGGYKYFGSSDTVFAKSFAGLGLYTTGKADLVDAPTINTFYTALTNLDYEDSSKLGLFTTSKSAEVSSPVIDSFYTALNNLDETDSANLGLYTTSNVAENTKPQPQQPFYTI